MNNLQIKRNIKFVTVEKSDAWVVFAFVVEIQDGKTVPVSEPRIVKVIQKKFAVLAGKVQKSKIVALSGPQAVADLSQNGIISPFSVLLSYSYVNTIPWVSALPPTFK